MIMVWCSLFVHIPNTYGLQFKMIKKMNLFGENNQLVENRKWKVFGLVALRHFKSCFNLKNKKRIGAFIRGRARLNNHLNIYKMLAYKDEVLQSAKTEVQNVIRNQ